MSGGNGGAGGRQQDEVATVSVADRPSPAKLEEAPKLKPGDLIQRYLILGDLGAGGMAFVYRAWDSELDRTVAIKVLRVAEREDGTEQAKRQRLLREAQALGQLSHPNVTSVYDVGAHEGILFIAMEYVEGKTLREWLQTPHPLPALLEALIAAGRGLAAVHAVGLVHRDFKPGNVIIGDDGRVRVLDFGLARLFYSPGDDTANEHALRLQPPVADAHRLLETQLTRTDFLVGTPAYMAPEQRLHGEVDARSDQYSFCVVLYLALYGTFPYSAEQMDALADGAHGELVPNFDKKKGVPAWLNRILERGLRMAPEQRYPSMESLLAELGRDRRTRRRRIALAAGAATVAACVAALAVARVPESDTTMCRHAAAQVGGAWDAAARQTLEAGFGATRHRAARAALDRVTQTLDGYATALRAAYSDACEATHVRGEQSAALLALRTQCLNRRRGQLAALVGVLGDHPDAAVVDAAPGAVLALPSVASCADEERLRVSASLPSQAPVRARMEAIGGELDRARALAGIGRSAAALAAARDGAQAADRLAIPWVEAEASLLLGTLLADGGDVKAGEASLRHAIERAAVAKDDSLLANAWLGLMSALRRTPERAAEARHLERAAEASVRRLGDVGLDARLAGYSAAMKEFGGDLDGAAHDFERAVTRGKQALGNAHPAVADWTAALAGVTCRRGDVARARRLYQEALAVDEAVLFAGHPALETILTPFGQCLIEHGDARQAVPILERALRILDQAGATTPARLERPRLLLARATDAER